MGKALLPCFKCGKTLDRVCEWEADSPPSEGTEFRTEGHYGSTFFDSFNGEEIVITICDPCLRGHVERIAQQKRYLPIRCAGMAGFVRRWVERPLVPFTGNEDRTEMVVDVEELGTALPGVEWVPDIEERKQWLEAE